MTKLEKNLGVFELFSFAAGSMISSGLFILPAIAYKEAGASAIIAYLLAGLLIYPSVCSKTELATAMPKAGGTYFYVERILGTPAGIIAGFANWFSIALKSAFALVGIGAFSTLIFPDLSPMQLKFIAVGFCVFFTFLNLISVKSSGVFQTWLVVFLLAILGVYIIAGYPKMSMQNFSDIDFKNYKSILEATGLVFIAYGGLTKIASVAEEAKNAGEVVPKAMFLAFFIVTAIYVLVVAITLGVISGETLQKSLTPISTSAGKFMGEFGLIITAIGAVLAFITTANAGILSASRAPLAMSRDKLIPSIFMKMSKRYKTPYFSILFTSFFMISVILFLEIEILAKVASTFMILLFIMVNFSVIVVRYTNMRNYRPSFKSPLFPSLQIFGIIVYSILISQMGFIPLFLTISFIILSYIWYKIYAQKKEKNISALFTLVKRILNRHLVENSESEILEEELLDILKERDEIIEDCFDKLIKNCTILEMEKEISKIDFFKSISKNLSGELNLTENEIFDKFCEREEMSNTNIHKHLAIPHIILDGENIFDIMLVRNKKGILWTDNSLPVHMVFVLIGTMDKRNDHLRALMAIAQIVQSKNFMKKWTSASDVEHLRSTILLSKRKRNV